MLRSYSSEEEGPFIESVNPAFQSEDREDACTDSPRVFFANSNIPPGCLCSSPFLPVQELSEETRQFQFVGPWVCVFWCLSHRLELSLKDALKSTFFDTIDDLLLRMYYLYEKSPKKCRALDDIVLELKSCFEESAVPLKGGIRPIRACGTRFIAHKVAALERMIDRFGAYLTHFVAMMEDDSVKAVDKQKIKGV